MKIRDDFPMLNNGIVYLDNSATTFKPINVINKMNEYYTLYTANAHRGACDISLKVDAEYEATRYKVKEFINASSIEEIIFTSGTTEALNIIVRGYFSKYLNTDDEIILSKSEHASNLLPWFKLCNENKCKIKYVDLDCDMKINIPNVLAAITPKTKVIALAQMTNVVGDIRDIKTICSLAHEKGILVVCDGAQSIAHLKIDVLDLGVDFFCFSAHKLYGPTGTGVLYGKKILLESMEPLNLGGGMNESFLSSGIVSYKELPHCFEAGTPNIAAVIGMGAAIDYLNHQDFKFIVKHEEFLKRYLIKKLLEIDHIELYNMNSEGPVVIFNVEGVSSQDLANYLSKYNVCVRSGNHCAKILKEELGIKNTCRASIAMYNSRDDIDKLVVLLKDHQRIIREIN